MKENIGPISRKYCLKTWSKNETPVKASSQDTPINVTSNQCGSKSTNTNTEGTQSE